MANDTVNPKTQNQILLLFTKGKMAGQVLNKVTGAVTHGAKTSVKAVGSVFDDFKTFIDKGNVVDLAVGIVMGAAFTAIVTSFVQDLITPIIGLATGAQLENAFVFLKQSDACRNNATLCSTPKLAQAAGSITWNWGNFIQTTINFIIISVIVFFIVKIYAAAFRRKKPVPTPTEKECLDCCKKIPLQAKRCAFCTSFVNDSPNTSTVIQVDSMPDMYKSA